MGVVSVACVLTLLMYPLRKRLRWLRFIGSTKIWFRTHQHMGVTTTVAALYHCSFQIGSLNSRLALTSLLLVAGSGLIGVAKDNLRREGVIPGLACAFVEIELDPGESAVAEAGAMMYKGRHVKMDAILGDGSKQGMFGKLLGMGQTHAATAVRVSVAVDEEPEAKELDEETQTDNGHGANRHAIQRPRPNFSRR